MKVELKERKAFLTDSKQVLLGSTALLEGKKTKDKMDRDNLAVSFLRWYSRYIDLDYLIPSRTLYL